VSPAAVALGRKDGKKGGPARAAKLPKEELVESARKATVARWKRGLRERARGGSPLTFL